MQILVDNEAIASLTILWAEFGQRIDNVTGLISDILPSRLNKLEKLCQDLKTRKCLAFPDQRVDPAFVSLDMRCIESLLKRPGGKKHKKDNEGKRLAELKHQLSRVVYRSEKLERTKRLFEELRKTALCYINEISENGNWGYLTNEGRNKKGETYLTFAGWIRHLCVLLFFLRKKGALKPMNQLYKPKSETLKPYFTEETAIDSKEKAYAFILGVLYGKLVQVQAARGVNVASNALTWLKRLTLKGPDLPTLYVKIREKLLAYETEQNIEVSNLVSELGELAIKTQYLESLDETSTCYFLLLGQSLSCKILPSKSKEKTGS